MSMKDWHFPATCHQCGALAVTPHRAVEAGDQIEMALRCTSCLHDYTVREPSPALFLIPKPDRRRSPRVSSSVE